MNWHSDINKSQDHIQQGRDLFLCFYAEKLTKKGFNRPHDGNRDFILLSTQHKKALPTKKKAV
jgi:hypothetical protein